MRLHGACVRICACAVWQGEGLATSGAPDVLQGPAGWWAATLLQRVLSSSLNRKQASISNPFSRRAISKKGPHSSIWAELLTLWEEEGTGQRCPQDAPAEQDQGAQWEQPTLPCHLPYPQGRSNLHLLWGWG